MLQKPYGLLLHELGDHVAQNSPHSIESLVCRTDIRKTNVIKQDFLHDKDSNCFAQLRTGLHDTEAKRDYLCCEKEVDDIGRVILDQRSDHTKRGEAEIFERARFGGRIQEWIKKKRDMSWKSFCISQEALQATMNCYAPFKNNVRVSLWEATHCNRASALQTRFEAAAVN